MRNNLFDDNDQIKIFDFLAGFVTIMLKISDEQEFVALPSFFADPA